MVDVSCNMIASTKSSSDFVYVFRYQRASLWPLKITNNYFHSDSQTSKLFWHTMQMKLRRRCWGFCLRSESEAISFIPLMVIIPTPLRISSDKLCDGRDYCWDTDTRYSGKKEHSRFQILVPLRFMKSARPRRYISCLKPHIQITVRQPVHVV